MKKHHPLSREDRLINAEEKERSRLSKEAAAERSSRIWRKRIKILAKEQETEDALKAAREGNIPQ